ncbi:unnamed protein product [Prunus armeniaca]
MTKDQESAASGSKNDASDPFFIHHSDHPGMVLVSKILYGNNYAKWCRSMRISLSAKNKLGFVNGTIKAPSEKTKPESFEVWQRCNDMVLSWLLNSIEPDIAESVLYSSTAQEIWEDLKERFSQLNAPRIFEIQRTIASFSQEQMSVAVYYTRMKSLWDELSSYSDVPACSCGAMKKHVEQEERNSLMQFLMRLNESYSAIRGQILLMKPLPMVRKAYSLITQEEKQRDLGSSQAITEPEAMAVRNNLRSNSSGRQPLHYSHCDRDHHTVDKCYKLHGYPPGHRLHKSGKGKGKVSSGSANNVASNGPSLQEIHTAMPSLSEDQCKKIHAMMSDNTNPSHVAPQANTALTSSGISELLPNLHWIIDSGATHHITSNLKLLTKRMSTSSMLPVTMPSGETAPIASTGTLPLNSYFYLQDVLCVPTFKVNLMSTRTTIGLGKERDGLYYLVALASDRTPSTTRPSCHLNKAPFINILASTHPNKMVLSNVSIAIFLRPHVLCDFKHTCLSVFGGNAFSLPFI